MKKRLLSSVTSEEGQGLIEAMLAVAVVMLVVYTLLNLGTLGLKNSRLAVDRMVATQLMQEGFEILRAKRDEPGGWSTFSSVTKDTMLCFDPANGNSIEEVCTEIGGDFISSYLIDNSYERTFVFEGVNRESGTCSSGCSACGKMTDSGGTVDDCSIKVTMQVAWPGVAESCGTEGNPILGWAGKDRYCVQSTYLLTNWR